MAPFRAACLTLLASSLVPLAACSPDFSPNTYNSGAVQQANKADQGVVVGVRPVDVKVSGTTGAVTGGAAGAIAGSQLPGSSATQALGAVGGTLIGGLLGSGVEQATGDTKAFEYIVRKPNGELVSVTQVDKVPLALGQRVLVIAGSQARIVADYTEIPPEKPKENVKPSDLTRDAQTLQDKNAHKPSLPTDSPPPEPTPAESKLTEPKPAEPKPAEPVATPPNPIP